MKTISISGLGGIAVFLVVAIASTALSISTLNAHAQNTTTIPQASQNQTVDPQQIKGYLNQAIQALDSGNNTKALEQVDIAGDQLETMMGTGAGEDDDEDEEEGEVDEGPGEDSDEPGDVDTNDQDTP
jgi:ribosome assembly protein YihI (activator of Der GTPase)